MVQRQFLRQRKTESVAASSVWTPDHGDGTYKNPIIYADYSDPDVIRVEGDFLKDSSLFMQLFFPAQLIFLLRLRHYNAAAFHSSLASGGI
jgi:hypothetical protein